MPSDLQIQTVNVGQPAVLRRLHKGPVFSSIAKTPVTTSELLLTYTNLQGDQQVDTKPKPDGRQLHGGNEMAVYVYPWEHYDGWLHELGVHLQSPQFGENLSITGIHEDQVHVGDKWQWGEAVLEVSKPRQPCYKLKWHLGIPDIEVRMWENGMCGWYLRVLTPGVVPTTGSILIVEVAEDAATIADVLQQKRSKNQ